MFEPRWPHTLVVIFWNCMKTSTHSHQSLGVAIKNKLNILSELVCRKNLSNLFYDMITYSLLDTQEQTLWWNSAEIKIFSFFFLLSAWPFLLLHLPSTTNFILPSQGCWDQERSYESRSVDGCHVVPFSHNELTHWSQIDIFSISLKIALGVNATEHLW